jgi:hypothetical protein
MAAKELPDVASSQSEESEFMKHFKAAGRAKVAQWKSLIPDEFWEYRREARREFLLALRSAVDAAIRELEAVDGKAAKDAKPKPPRSRPAPRKARVEVE